MSVKTSGSGRPPVLPAAAGSRVRRGLSLLEAAVVVAVAGIIAALAIPTFDRLETQSRVHAKSAELAGVLTSARTLRLLSQDEMDWQEALAAAAGELGDGTVSFAADGGEVGEPGRCSFPDGTTMLDGRVFRCRPGEGTSQTPSEVIADPTEWTITGTVDGWNAVSLHTRHLVILSADEQLLVQLAADEHIWAYGRVLFPEPAAAEVVYGRGAVPVTTVPVTTVPVTTVPVTTVPVTTAPVTTVPVTTVPVTTVPVTTDSEIWIEPEPDPGPVGDVQQQTTVPVPRRWWEQRTVSDCHFGGWESAFPTGLFKNRGDCQSYFSTDGRNLPDGPLAHMYPLP